MGTLSVPVEYEGMTLKLNQGVLEYLAGINTALEWEERGFKATRYKKDERSKVQQQIIDEVKDRLDFDNSDKLNAFAEESIRIFQALLNKNFDVIHDLFQGNEIYFITGPPRTGGTYVLKALLELRNENLKDFNHKLIFDYTPLNTQLGSNYGTNHTNQVLFEWAQWMVWVGKRFDLENYNFIPKKHIGMLYQLDLFDQIFGEKAHYIVTTRDPAEAYQSYADRFFTDNPAKNFTADIGLWKHSVLPRTNIDEERWEDFSFPDQFLLYWCACYLEILNYGKEEQIHPLVFGKDYERFLKEFAWEHNLVYSPETFDPTERDELPEFSEPCQKMKEKVEVLWEDKFGKALY